MRNHFAKGLSLFVIPTLVMIGLTGCTDEKIVYRDRPVYDEPADGAGDFVGYTLTGAETPIPSCANCHVGPSSEWSETDHASAWATLEESGHAQEFCRGCHTVSEFGNPVTGASGYNGSQDSLRYKDVQCESCHGPGLPHVAAPDGSGPLASMLAGSDLTNGCGECHAGEHHPFVEQWEASAHGNVQSFAAGRDGCKDCHSGNGSLERWGFNANYTEKADFDAGNGYMDITCGVCHDPHGGPNSAQLRFPIENTSVEGHLCAQCHNRRAIPDPGSSHGTSPHSPETALLQGEAGFFFPGMEITPPAVIVGSHGNEGNTRLCAGCHVDNWEVTDETGEFAFQAVGHTFDAIPCLGEDGIPTGETECALNTEDRYFGSCATSGCHSTATAALGALQSATSLNKLLSDEVEELLEQVPDDELDGSDGVITVAEGAEFNRNLAYFGRGRAGEDIDARLGYTGSAAHNPFSTRELLVASIEALKKEYGLSATSEWYQNFILENPELLPRWTGQ